MSETGGPVESVILVKIVILGKLVELLKLVESANLEIVAVKVMIAIVSSDTSKA